MQAGHSLHWTPQGIIQQAKGSNAHLLSCVHNTQNVILYNATGVKSILENVMQHRFQTQQK